MTPRVLICPLNESQTLLLNTLSGAVDVLHPTEVKALRSPEGGYPPLSKALLERLQQRGYLFGDAASEKALWSRLEQLAIQQAERIPIRFVFLLGTTGWIHCAQSALPPRHVDFETAMDEQSMQDALKAMDSLCWQFKREGRPWITGHGLFGQWGLLRPFLNAAVTMGYHPTIEINAEQLPTEASAWCDVAQYLDGVQVTALVQPNTINETLIQGIEVLLAQNVSIHLRLVVSEKELQALESIVLLAETQGWILAPEFSCSLSPIQRLANKRTTLFTGLAKLLTADNYYLAQFTSLAGLEPFSRVHERLYGRCLPVRYDNSVFQHCIANDLSYLALTPDGRIYPCPQTIGNPKAMVGTFSPQLILKGQYYEKWVARSIFRIEECASCSVATLCGGGCAYLAWQMRGSLLTAWCEDTRQEISTYINMERNRVLQAVAQESRIPT